MKKTILALCVSIAMINALDACVTVNTGKGTYEIDGSGCVDHGSKVKRPKKDKKEKSPKENSVRSEKASRA
jgi:hypothetical protein